MLIGLECPLQLGHGYKCSLAMAGATFIGLAQAGMGWALLSLSKGPWLEVLHSQLPCTATATSPTSRPGTQGRCPPDPATGRHI